MFVTRGLAAHSYSRYPSKTDETCVHELYGFSNGGHHNSVCFGVCGRVRLYQCACACAGSTRGRRREPMCVCLGFGLAPGGPGCFVCVGSVQSLQKTPAVCNCRGVREKVVQLGRHVQQRPAERGAKTGANAGFGALGNDPTIQHKLKRILASWRLPWQWGLCTCDCRRGIMGQVWESGRRRKRWGCAVPGAV